ncbi:hypothetical protein Kpho02_50710 [Kitasatospora phosalacinea]|uniref:Uncharacterized protein n=1 Tax=Kitasatospora phosalacinea TaxID=2065 RepID=A0A9W6Q9R9_9ACTN|nr:hypothetical protein Kpho02_50710 [Kitasatospora phosalacinea]
MKALVVTDDRGRLPFCGEVRAGSAADTTQARFAHSSRRMPVEHGIAHLKNRRTLARHHGRRYRLPRHHPGRRRTPLGPTTHPHKPVDRPPGRASRLSGKATTQPNTAHRRPCARSLGGGPLGRTERNDRVTFRSVK